VICGLLGQSHRLLGYLHTGRRCFQLHDCRRELVDVASTEAHRAEEGYALGVSQWRVCEADRRSLFMTYISSECMCLYNVLIQCSARSKYIFRSATCDTYKLISSSIRVYHVELQPASLLSRWKMTSQRMPTTSRHQVSIHIADIAIIWFGSRLQIPCSSVPPGPTYFEY
jgi:hypothetical protein